MNENLSINYVEKMTGVSKRNIRFYEKEGLLLPKRNQENGYRVYDENDIWRIKVIKMLRMLDMPLEEIKYVLEEEKTLRDAIVNQQAELEQKAKELQAAISFCDQLKETELDMLDVDGCLEDIEHIGKDGFFKDWVKDYKCVVDENRDLDFSFIPDIAITNEREFTDALFQYADKEKVNLVITKESMYPEFTINGVEYTAERNYTYMGGIPLAVVNCHRRDRELIGEDIEVSRKNMQWFLHKWGWLLGGLIFDIILLVPIIMLEESIWLKLLMAIGLIGTQISMRYRENIFHFNDKTK